MRYILLTFGLILSLSMPTLAQKPKTITNDDFPSGIRADSKTEKEKEAEKEAEKKDDKSKSDDKDSKDSKDSKDDKVKKDDKTKKDEEKAKEEKAKKDQEWQKKNTELDQKQKELDQQKTQAELSIQQLRNRLRSGNLDPKEFDTLSQQIKDAEQNLGTLNSKYAEAKSASEQFKKEGEGQGYKPKLEDIPKTNKDGSPNPTYYTKNYKDLSEKQQTAESKIQLYQNRLNEAQQRAYQGRSSKATRVGNSYYTDPETKKAIDQAQAELKKAQEEYEKSTTSLEQLQREARSSGVSIK
ncbi:MAG: hypothetical protein HY819_17495 [Acidobacteria bacterium]|nr:hypothetical protein [Acidobacteriota bacterium]